MCDVTLFLVSLGAFAVNTLVLTLFVSLRLPGHEPAGRRKTPSTGERWLP